MVWKKKWRNSYEHDKRGNLEGTKIKRYTNSDQVEEKVKAEKREQEKSDVKIDQPSRGRGTVEREQKHN